MAELILFRGPFHRLEQRLRIVRGDRADLLRHSLLFFALGWLPVVVLSIVDRLSFYESLNLLTRWIVGVPALFLTERILDHRIDRALHYLIETKIVPEEERAQFDGMRARAARLSESRLLEIVLLAGSIAMSFPRLLTPRPAAEVWNLLVALPLFRFLLARFLLRWCAWCWLLVRISKLDLHLMGTHPDRNGGLSVLAEPSRALGLAGFGIAAVSASAWIQELARGVIDATKVNVAVAAVMVLVLSLAFAPLFAFAPVLRRTKHRFIHEYAAFSHNYAERFHEKWIGPTSLDPLGQADMQSFADLGSVFDTVHQMQLSIVSRQAALTVAISTFLPFVPLFLIDVPLRSIAPALLKIIM